MTISDWIRYREMTGKPCFSFADVRESFPKSTEKTIANTLSRLAKRKVVALLAKGFYCVIPAQYALQGVLPPTYYVDQLMNYYGKPYYVGLLSAAAFWGAAHQRPQQFSIITAPPKFQRSQSRNRLLLWFYRQVIPEKFLLEKNTETSAVRYSNAELTAIDLVQFEQHIGGLSRASTVLSELLENTNFKGAAKELFTFTTLPAIQRLGYIVDEVLEDKEQADVIYSEMLKYRTKIQYCYLSNRCQREEYTVNKRWKILINTEIEPDDIW
jgi:predicted transcriptional regulator of viral defense system